MKKKVSVIALVILSMVTACTTPVIKYQTINTASNSNKLNTTVSGKVVFPSSLSVKATLTDIESKATVSIIYLPDNHYYSNLIVATGLSDSNGNFTINTDSSFAPNQGDIFILEATKRLGGSGNSLMSLRTYVQLSVKGWKSITKQDIVINTQTTALAAMVALMSSSVTPSDTIETIDLLTSNNVLSDIKHSGNTIIHASSVLTVADLVSYALSKNYDPLHYIVFNNGIFSIKDPQKIVNIITTVAGSDTNSWLGDNLAATNAALNNPSSICMDKNGNLYIVGGNSRIRKVDKTTGIIKTFVGNGSYGFSGDNGPATSAQINSSSGITFELSGNLYLVDSNNYRIRKVDKITGIITTVAGIGIAGYSGDNGSATSALINSPNGIAFDLTGNLYIADTNNGRIRRVDKTTGIITTFAGGGSSLGDGSPATSVQLNFPQGITFDSAGSLYIIDSNKIKKVDSLTGIITTVAGSAIQGYSGDNDPATTSSLNNPQGIVFDSTGNLYIADTNNYRIRKVDKTTGIITTIAGGYIQGYSGDDGPATSARLNSPTGITIDSLGNLYFIDGYNKIRKVDTKGIISLVAGGNNSGFGGDNDTAIYALFNNISGINIDPSGNLFIADRYNSRIRKIVLSSTTAP